MSSHDPDITILDYDDFMQIEKHARNRLSQIPSRGYDEWNIFHSTLCDVLQAHDKPVTFEPDANDGFYHTMDWSHHLVDSFGMTSKDSISKPILIDWHNVVKWRSADALLLIEGVSDGIDGLRGSVTAEGIYIAWYKSDGNTCRTRLRKLGLQIV